MESYTCFTTIGFNQIRIDERRHFNLRAGTALTVECLPFDLIKAKIWNDNDEFNWNAKRSFFSFKVMGYENNSYKNGLNLLGILN